jgi:hypothetical protein
VDIGAAEARALRELCHLLALSIMEQNMADFRMADFMDASQARMVARELQRVCRCVRGWVGGWTKGHPQIASFIRAKSAVRCLILPPLVIMCVVT